MKVLIVRFSIALLVVYSFCVFCQIALSQDPASESKKPQEKSCSEPIYQNVKELSKRVKLKNRFEPPEPPEEARNKRMNGCVILKIVLCKSGKVTDVRVISGLPYGLTERVIKAARKLRITPAEKDGQPVSQSIQIESCFGIH